MINAILVEGEPTLFDGAENVLNETIKDIIKDGHIVTDLVPVNTNDSAIRSFLIKYITSDEVQAIKQMRAKQMAQPIFVPQNLKQM